LVELGVRFPTNFDPQDIIDSAKYAEDLGYTSLWMQSDLSPQVLSVVATKTSKIQLGTGILSIYRHDPNLIALQAELMDTLSHGRLILGLGSSTPPLVERVGLKFEKPLGRMEDYIKLVNMYLTERRVNYKGKVFTIERGQGIEEPFRKHIPIYISALNPKMLHLTGALADGVIANVPSVETVKQSVEWLNEGARSAGRDPSSLVFAAYVTGCIDDDMAASVKACRPTVANYSIAPFYKDMIARSFPEEVKTANDLFFVKNERQRSAESIPDRMVQAMCLCGNREQFRARVDEYTKAGLEKLVFCPAPTGDDPVGNTKKQLADAMS